MSVQKLKNLDRYTKAPTLVDFDIARNLEKLAAKVDGEEVEDTPQRLLQHLQNDLLTKIDIAQSIQRIAEGFHTIKGEKGDQGESIKGDVGPQGSMGPEGPEGPQGPVGPQGKDGPSGRDGESIVGPQGPEGKEGPEGKQGPQGPKGDMGLQGEDGEDGSPDTPTQIANKLISIRGTAAIKRLAKILAIGGGGNSGGSSAITIGDELINGTEGSVIFLGPSGAWAQNNNDFNWNNTVDFLRMGDWGVNATLTSLVAGFGAAGPNLVLLGAYSYGSGDPATFFGIKSRGTAAVPLATQDDDRLFAVAASGFNSDNMRSQKPSGGMIVRQDGAPGVLNIAAKVRLWVNDGTGSETAVLQVRANSNVEFFNNAQDIIALMEPTATFTLGLAGTATGKLQLAGITSGTATITSPAVAGAPTLTTPIVSGQIALFDGANLLSVGTTTPSSPTVGDLWVDTN